MTRNATVDLAYVILFCVNAKKKVGSCNEWIGFYNVY